MYVIQNCDDAKFVARPGSQHSYTNRLQDARVFQTRDDAERERCGNETIVLVDNLLRGS